ncbi:MAG: hypothetical protein ACPGTG_06815, partial [Flavobacteriales bacterium]
MKLIISIFLILLVSCTKEDVKPLDLTQQIVKKYEAKTSLSYDIDYRIKYFSQLDDTTKVSAKIDLIRQDG